MSLREILNKVIEAELAMLAGSRRIIIGETGEVDEQPVGYVKLNPRTLPLEAHFGKDVSFSDNEIRFRTRDIISGVLGTLSHSLVGSFLRTNAEVFFVGRFPLTPLARGFLLLWINGLLAMILFTVPLFISIYNSGEVAPEQLFVRGGATFVAMAFMVAFARLIIWISDNIVGSLRRRTIVRRISEIIVLGKGPASA